MAEITCAEAGRKGGLLTSARWGREHYVLMGRKGARANRALHDHAYFVAIGAQGGRTAARNAAAMAEARREDSDGEPVEKEATS